VESISTFEVKLSTGLLIFGGGSHEKDSPLSMFSMEQLVEHQP
jgi:hypothetical protein